MVVNLLLHHFSERQLSELFAAVSRRGEFFLAIEPRRHAAAWALSRLVGVIGCNAVTRHDAPVSVRAGFRDHELSRLWPGDGEWRVKELASGFLGHLFVAERARP